MTLATPPVSVVYAFSVGKHETLVAFRRWTKIRNAAVPVAFSTDGGGNGEGGGVDIRSLSEGSLGTFFPITYRAVVGVRVKG